MQDVLDQILIFVPYSPRTLNKMKEEENTTLGKPEEEAKQLEQPMPSARKKAPGMPSVIPQSNQDSDEFGTNLSAFSGS
jgi:hypothetical protein